MYSDFINNPKLWNVPETFQLRYVKLMCLRSAGELPGMSVEQLAWALRLTTEEIIKTLDALEVAGLWQDGDIYNWDKRQYVSDNSTTRTRRHRAKQQKAERSRNVPGTPSDTDTDTDTDKKNTRAFARDVLAYLNAKTGRNFSNTSEIEKCIKREKCTVADCHLVIDHKWAEWGATDLAKNVNAVTPWRPSHFGAYLDEARAGPPRTAQQGSRKIADNPDEEFFKQGMEDAGKIQNH
jgi:uncharacterized phage protein (TIGR02220 family)